MARFEQAVLAALEEIPAPFQRHLDSVEVLIEPGSAEGLMGLYEGGTALEEGWPDRITIYKESHEDAVRTWTELVEEVRRTILHEVGHHFGMDEDELPY